MRTLNHRMDVLHFLIETFQLQRYLEIGCRDDETFAGIPCLDKTGVDPVQGGNVRMASDDFFAQLEQQHPRPTPFDLIFIDGDHHHPQVVRDLDNARKWVRDDGFIAMHDVFLEMPHLEGPSYSGTTWRAFAWGRGLDDLDGVVYRMHQDPVGLGVIVKRANSLPVVAPRLEELDNLKLSDMHAHQADWMRVSNVPQLLSFLKLPEGSAE